MAERIVIEMLERDRWKELATWELSSLAVGLFHGLKPEVVNKAVGILRDDLSRHLFHTMYNKRDYIRRVRRELTEAQAEKQRLTRLDSMTVK